MSCRPTRYSRKALQGWHGACLRNRRAIPYGSLLVAFVLLAPRIAENNIAQLIGLSSVFSVWVLYRLFFKRIRRQKGHEHK